MIELAPEVLGFVKKVTTRSKRYLGKYSEETEIRDYTFQIELLYTEFSKKLNKKLTTTSNFTYKKVCKLSDYLKDLDALDIELNLNIAQLDTLKLVDENTLQFHIDRVRRKARVAPPVVIHPEEKAEFLEFTEDVWGGSWEVEGKLGCCLHILKGEVEKKNDINIVLKDLQNTPFYRFSEGMGDSWEELSIDDKRKVVCRLAHEELMAELEEEMYSKPYRLYLYGNDDLSYSKGFDSEEELEKELKYLRTMQPLDMNIDIYARDYIFTN